MSLIQRIKAEQVSARKQKLTAVASVLTTLIGEAEMVGKNAGREVTDAEVQAVIRKFIKNNNETIQALGDNDPRTLEFMGENVTLERFLPKQLTTEELTAVIRNIRDGLASRLTTVKMGDVMQVLKAKHDGLYDGKTASMIIKVELA